MAVATPRPRPRAAKSKPVLDLRFQHFGKWFVQGRASGKGKERFWVCQCDCGKTTAEIHEDALVEGQARSCGCEHVIGAGEKRRYRDLMGQCFSTYLVMAKAEKAHGLTRWACCCLQCGKQAIRSACSLIKSFGCASCVKTNASLNGKRFGTLYVIESVGVKGRKQYYKCLCSCCGQTTIVRGDNLTSGVVASCGRKTEKAKARIDTVYGFLEVLSYSPGYRTDGKKVRAQCLIRCQCGRESSIDAQTLRCRSGPRSCHKCQHLYRRSLTADQDIWDMLITASAQRQQGVQA